MCHLIIWTFCKFIFLYMAYSWHIASKQIYAVQILCNEIWIVRNVLKQCVTWTHAAFSFTWKGAPRAVFPENMVAMRTALTDLLAGQSKIIKKQRRYERLAATRHCWVCTVTNANQHCWCRASDVRNIHRIIALHDNKCSTAAFLIVTWEGARY